MNKWTLKEFAEEQYAVVSKEVCGTSYPSVYREFGDALLSINNRETLLDIGCGVGGYGSYCNEMFPEISYSCTDISEHMIEFAKKLAPDGDSFSVCDFFDNDVTWPDVVLTSSAIEYTRDAWDAARFLLNNAPGAIIFHRLHLTHLSSHQVYEPTYYGARLPKMHWNKNEILDLLRLTRKVGHVSEWAGGQMLTVVVEPK